MVPTTWKSKTVYDRGQRIKFVKSGKYEYDFKSGDFGIIERVVSPFPSATDTIYLVLPEKSGELMWVTGNDIVAFDQLTIEHEKASKVKLMCDSNYYEDLVPCCREWGHLGMHQHVNGLQWLTTCPPVAKWGPGSEDLDWDPLSRRLV